jgi:hypothetical protein
MGLNTLSSGLKVSRVTIIIFDRLRAAFGLKSVPTPQISITDAIISNHGPIKGYSQIRVLSKFSDQCSIYWLELGLGHTSKTSLDVNLRKWETAIDLRIGGRFENLIKGHRSEVQ